MKILADDVYFFQKNFKDFITGNIPGKFGEQILTFYGIVQHFVIFPWYFCCKLCFKRKGPSP